MRIRYVFLFATVLGVGAPAVADIPDGQGGRTSPQASTPPDAEAVVIYMACCRDTAVEYRDQVTSPPERKSLGHLAWVDARTEPEPLRLCHEIAPAVPVSFGSPAELKALGHLAYPPGPSEAAARVPSVARMACCHEATVQECRVLASR